MIDHIINESIEIFETRYHTESITDLHEEIKDVYRDSTFTHNPIHLNDNSN